MKKKLFTILSLIGLMGIGTLTACNVKTVESVKIAPSESQTVEVDKTIQFTAEVLPSDVGNKNVTWSVSDANVGSINQTGLFTALAAGNTTVTVTTKEGNKTASCNVTVKAKPTPTPTIDSVTINPRGSQSVEKGQTIDFTVVVTGSQTDKSVVWSVEGTGASIDQQGHFVANAAGEVTVKATATKDSTKSDSCKVTITEPAPTPIIESVTMSPRGTSTAIVGDKINFTVDVQGTEQDKSVVWSISDDTKASIDQQGHFEALAEGEVTVTVTSTKDSSKKDTCVVTISPAPYIASVTISPRGTSTAIVGDTIDFIVTVAGTEEDQSVIWSVSDAEKASIDQQGHFEALAAGEVTVKATATKDSTKYDTCVVTISPAPYIESVTINQGATSSAIVGGTIDFTVTVTGTEQDKSVVWSVSDDTKASIDQQGHFVANAAGEVTVKATATKDSTKYDTCVVTIANSYSVSLGGTSHDLVAHATEANTYVLSEAIALTAEQSIAFSKNGTAITSNINPDGDNTTDKIYNNVLNGKVCWSATSANLKFHVNGDNYTYWIEGGHAFPTDGYYLFGSEITWEARFASVQGQETSDKIVFTRDVVANEEFVVVYVQNGAISADGRYDADASSTGCTVTSDKNIKITNAGKYMITFTKAAVGTKTYKYEVVDAYASEGEYNSGSQWR